mgnify:CR=1 FL=1
MYCYIEDPDLYEAVTEHTPCPFHLAHPNNFSNFCTCTYSYKMVRRSPEEYNKIKKEKRKIEEDRILAQAELIKYQRSLEN